MSEYKRRYLKVGSQKIELLRKALNDSIKTDSIISDSVLAQSRKLDAAIIEYYRNTLRDKEQKS